jgi:hypothetical protein
VGLSCKWRKTAKQVQLLQLGDAALGKESKCVCGGEAESGQKVRKEKSITGTQLAKHILVLICQGRVGFELGKAITQ